jgi:hypothetical protein
MKRLLWPLLAAAVAGCDPYRPPVIESFYADNANPAVGATVQLIFTVHDASILSIIPAPGEVTGSPVTVRPTGPTTYTLRAGNDAGWSSKDVTVNARVPAGARVVQFSVVPSQAAPGVDRTLTWNIANTQNVQLTGPGLDTRVGLSGQMTVTPTVTSTWTINATSAPGFDPLTARAVARVLPPTSISSFIATPSAILQGETSTLSWDGSAFGWTLTAGGTTTEMGVAKQLVVRPAASTTYSLTGLGPGGVAGPQTVTVQVTPRPGTTLQYTPPPSGSEKLRLIADACSAPCPNLTLRLVAAVAVSLRGVAIDVPMDSSKTTLDPSTFSSSFDAGKAVIGTGPLKETLVLGAALQGNAGTPAADRALGAGDEVSHFVLALQPAGGQGVIFDGGSAFSSWIQSASGRAPGGIAVGKLEAK